MKAFFIGVFLALFGLIGLAVVIIVAIRRDARSRPASGGHSMGEDELYS